jgi:hypothetical protein
MPIYEYRAEDGSLHEHVCEMSKAPPIGHKVTIDGKVYTRQIPRTVEMAPAPEYSFVSPQVEDDAPGVPYRNAAGDACFRSKNEVREFCAASRSRREQDGKSLVWHMDGRAESYGSKVRRTRRVSR